MTERTPTDYALEFAEYMAKGAEQLIEAVNALALAEQARDEGDGDELDAKVDEARQDCTEFLTGLRNDIYQFRTRRDRAARAAPSLTVGAELTNEQILAIWDAHLVPAFGKQGFSPIVFARNLIAALPEPAAQAEPVAWTTDFDLENVRIGFATQLTGRAMRIAPAFPKKQVVYLYTAPHPHPPAQGVDDAKTGA